MLLIALAVALVPAARLAAADKPEEIIDRAIKAVGGLEAINKQKAMTWKEKGTYHGMGTALPYDASFAYQLPDRFRMEIKGVFTTVIDGDKGWVSEMGNVRDMSADELANQKEQYRLAKITMLAPLRKEKGYELSPAATIKVNDREAFGVKVSQEKSPDVTLWFDGDTNLLVKAKSKVKSQEKGKEVDQEMIFSDYKDVEGLKMPMKYVILQDGEKFLEGEMTETKFVDKVDDSLFEKP